jgi:transglutaminase-like putative cysteine protease
MQRTTLSLAIALAALGASSAGAQAPRVTPAGDPSVKSDSIYALAVKPSDYADQPYVYLLDDGIVKLEADGTGTSTYRQIVQILTPEAAEQWGERSFGYSTDREKLTLNWARVLRPDGSVITGKPVHEQESLAPVAMEAPVYSDEKLHRISLGGIAPGTIVDYSYTVQTLKPIIPRDFLTAWRVSTGRLTRRSRLIVDVPESLEPRIEEHHLSFARKEVTAGGRRIYTWARTDVPKPELEPLAPDSSYGESLVIAAPITWSDIAQWYAGLAKGRYALTPQIEQALAKTVAGSKTLDDSIRAVHRWVAQDFRYVSLSLGIAGFQPHPPSEVFANNYGDCKDKATFFVALMNRMGVTAYPVLLSSSGGVIRTLPSGHQFDHMIAAVDRSGRRTYVDLTADIVPFGALPPREQGEFGLVVHPDGASEEITFPSDPPAANRTEMHLVGSLTPDGLFAGKWTRMASGAQQYSLRASMSKSTKPDSTERARTTLAIANAIFDGSAGDSLQLFDGRDLNAEPKISVLIRHGKAASDAGGTEILTIPLTSYAVTNLVSALEARGPRKSPIASEKVGGPHTEIQELRLTLPAGWKAKLPPNDSATSVFGTYVAEYSQSGRELRIVRSLTGTDGVQPATKYAELLEWLKQMSKDDAKYVILEH